MPTDFRYFKNPDFFFIFFICLIFFFFCFFLEYSKSNSHVSKVNCIIIFMNIFVKFSLFSGTLSYTAGSIT